MASPAGGTISRLRSRLSINRKPSPPSTPSKTSSVDSQALTTSASNSPSADSPVGKHPRSTRPSAKGNPSTPRATGFTSLSPHSVTGAAMSPADLSVGAQSLSGPKQNLRALYPPIEPFDSGRLKVDKTHEIYWEASGNRKGKPVVFLHGGPGGGASRDDRRWFDPEHYRIYTFDQRGAGKSTPTACLENNTTWDLVADIERLREQFDIPTWHVFGGSWGSTLALAYAQSYPDRVSALILRGIFTLRRSELLFFYQNGASHLFPDAWEPYYTHIPEDERDDMISAYYKRLTSEDENVRLEAARRWSTWENMTSKLYIDADHVARGEDDKWALAFARIESHFFKHAGWMDDGQLLSVSQIDKIRHIPAVIVQGRYDVVCPATTAWELHKVWPEAEFHLVPDAGHSAREPGNTDRLITATDRLRNVGWNGYDER